MTTRALLALIEARLVAIIAERERLARLEAAYRLVLAAPPSPD